MSHFDTLEMYSCGKHCEKGEIACNKQFLLFSKCFLLYMPLIFHFKMSSAICFNLDQSKICRLVLGLPFIKKQNLRVGLIDSTAEDRINVNEKKNNLCQEE